LDKVYIPLAITEGEGERERERERGELKTLFD
jgi:hypothetical protein